MKKLLFFLAALFVSLGIQAQASDADAVAQRGAEKGYYPFPAEVTKMKRLTTLDELTEGKRIMIQHSHIGTPHEDHEGAFLMMYSLPETGQTYHGIFMQHEPVGVGIFGLEATDAAGTFKLQTAHMMSAGDKCYVGELNNSGLKTTALDNYAGKYLFTPSGEGRWTIQHTQTGYYIYVESPQDGTHTINRSQQVSDHCYFDVYEVEETHGTVKYVECDVTLTGPSGNTFKTHQEGWSDFYEFIKQSNADPVSGVIPENYGVKLSNMYYHEASNEITGFIKFPFSVSGNHVNIPVHLNPSGDENKRFTVDENNTVKVITKPDGEPKEGDGWYKNEKNQWYIIPHLDENRQLSYTIQNRATKQYLYTESNSLDLLLSDDTPTYFKLNSGAPDGQVRFSTYYTKNNTTYVSYLAESSGKGTTSTSTWNKVANFLVTTISGEELGGEDAIGFVRRYTNGTSFWDGGQVNLEDAPVHLVEVFNRADHEGLMTESSNHLLYCAETGITVTKLDNVTATFNYVKGSDQLVIFGVDILNQIGEVVDSDYHLGTAGSTPSNNTYTIANVFPGEYTLRYWVCHRTDNEANKNHNLNNTSGSISVTGANYRIMFSQPLVNGEFAANTTWFRLRLHDELQRYISAQPAYMDDNNHLKLTNNTPPSDNAGLWAVVGNATDGYKFYNRAWGPKYALSTTGYETGNGGSARTYMVPADSASVYDIVNVPGSYTFSVKLRVDDTDNAYFNYRDGYLGIWNSGDALGEANSIMTFETVNMEGWDESTEALMNDIKKRWRPWIAEPEIGTAYYYVIQDADFAFMMQNRLSIFIGLDGKVFKFANIDTDDNKNPTIRTGKILAVHSDSKVAGIAATETIQDYLQLFHNGNGTFKLYHPQSGRYLKTPDNAETTADVAEAANFTYDMYEDEEGIVAFKTGAQMIHLKNNGDPLLVMNYNHIEDDASRWGVSYSQEAQDLVGVIATARARYAEVMAATYQANLGVPGYATAATVAALNDSITAALASTDFVAAKAMLEAAMQAITEEENAPLFPIDCYFTITNKNGRGSVVYDDAADKPVDTANGNAAYLWHNTSVDAANVNHLWGFCYNPIKEEYYLYNVGAQQFASPVGKGTYGNQGDTWIFSDVPVAISLTDLGDKYFHIQGGDKTMSISTSYYGSVITYYAVNDPGVPFKFDKSAKEFDEELYKEMEKKVVLAGLTYVTDLAKLGNAAIYGISTSRGPIAYLTGTENKVSTPKKGSNADIPANAIDNAGEQFALLRTENTPEGKYYLYNLSKQRFVRTGADFSEHPAPITWFSGTSSAAYPWFVWLGNDQRININAGNGLIMCTASYAKEDAGNQFRIQYVKTDAEATAAALEAIALMEEAILKAQTLLDETPHSVGYPTEAQHTTLQGVLDACESVQAINAASDAFLSSTDIIQPGSGKVYVFTNVHPASGKKYLNYTEGGLTMEARGEGAASSLPQTAKWYCRTLPDGRHVFVNTAGKYLVFKGSSAGTNGNKGYVDAYDAEYSPLTFQKMVTGGNTTGGVMSDFFGKVAFGGNRTNLSNGKKYSYFVVTAADGFEQDGGWVPRYDNSYSTAFIVEEAGNYPLADTKLTAVDADDTLLGGMTPGQTIGTFSAPYATVLPEGVMAYRAEEAEQSGTAYLKPIAGGVVPAQEGVILVGTPDDQGTAPTLINMLPVAGEQVVALSSNQFANSAMGDVVIGDYDYILANGSEGIGIYKAKPGTKLKQGKAYLSFLSATAARSFTMHFGAATAVDAPLAAPPAEAAVYDLSGRRITQAPKSGVYIVNGKKVWIK